MKWGNSDGTIFFWDISDEDTDTILAMTFWHGTINDAYEIFSGQLSYASISMYATSFSTMQLFNLTCLCYVIMF